MMTRKKATITMTRTYTELVKMPTFEERYQYLKLNGKIGEEGHDIYVTIYVHHMNPITLDMLRNDDPILLDPDNLICTSRNTHEAITLGDESLLPSEPIVRRPNDTCPWKQ